MPEAVFHTHQGAQPLLHTLMWLPSSVCDIFFLPLSNLGDGTRFYLPFRANFSDPLSVLTENTSALPAQLHAKLVAMHRPQLQARGIDPASTWL